jgi:hypothetical protein
LGEEELVAIEIKATVPKFATKYYLAVITSTSSAKVILPFVDYSKNHFTLRDPSETIG